MNSRTPLLTTLGAFAFVGLLGWQSPNISPITNPTTRVSGLNAHDESASGSLLGEFRTNTSAWLWLHADLYLHNGVTMRPITSAEEKAGVSVQGAKKDGQENLDASASITTIPSAERDFRGVFGDAEREIAAYKDMHDHTHNEPEQCLPLYRLMTWLDPQFIEAWTTGAMIFARDRSPIGTQRALNFLHEGLAANPQSVDILTEIAYVHLTRQRAFRDAIVWLEQARRYGHVHKDNLSEAEMTALNNTYRWLCLCYRDIDDAASVRSVAAEGLAVFPDDKPLERLLKHASEASSTAAQEAEGLRDRD